MQTYDEREQMQPELFFHPGTELGEGPIWDAALARLLFVDIMRGHIHELDPVTRAHRVLSVGQPVGAVAPAARGDWVAAVKTGFARVDPATGRVTPLVDVEPDIHTNRMNDGYVDGRGRLWAGTMCLDDDRPDQGALYRLDPDLTVHRLLAPVSISNGIDWSPDRRLMYYVDTPTGRVDVFDFDDERGELGARRTLAVIARPASPDGLIVDADGFVWVALWRGGAVHRYAPDGGLDRVVTLPVPLVTKCAFGGPALDDLYITTAFIALSPEERARHPLAGGLFHVRPGVRGQPPRRFGG